MWISGIYGIQNTKNGRWYIGATIDLRTRLMSHVYALKKGKSPNPVIQKDWNDMG